MATSAKSPNFFSRLVKGSGPKSPDDAQAAHNRRREQVRRAQRTHRERKEKYVKNLELEVAKLREQDAVHVQEIAAFKQKIRHLQDLLTSNGIAVPAHLLLSQTPSPQASIAVVNLPDGSQGIHATMPDIQSFEDMYIDPASPISSNPLYPPTTTGSSSEPGIYQHTMSSASEHHSSVTSQTTIFNNDFQNSTPASHIPNSQRPSQGQQNSLTPNNKSRNNYHPHGLDAAQIAVDFVLALESPCLLHHPDEPGTAMGDEPSGHALMLQSPIMNRCPSPIITHHNSNPAAPPPRYPANMTWNVPAQEIEKLLGLSARLSLEGEITPIEAWQRVRGHPKFVHMDAGRLNALKTVLVSEVRCYGFGAVIDEDYFDMILRQAYAQITV